MNVIDCAVEKSLRVSICTSYLSGRNWLRSIIHEYAGACPVAVPCGPAIHATASAVLILKYRSVESSNPRLITFAVMIGVTLLVISAVIVDTLGNWTRTVTV